MKQLELQIEEQEKKWVTITNRLISIAMYIIIAVLIALVIFLNLFTLCKIVGSSMENTLKDQQYAVISSQKSAKRGDILVFSLADREYKLIKRVIATGGESVLLASSDDTFVDIYIKNDSGYNRLNESYIKERIAYPAGGRFSEISVYSFVVFNENDADNYVKHVPKNHYFVMGDNRNRSDDSREFGCINKSQVTGRLIFKLKKGSYLEKLFRYFYKEHSTE